MKRDERQVDDFDDYLESVEVKNFFERARREMFPKLKASAISLIIHAGDPDPKLCLELGAAILFDKPLIICAMKGKPVPPLLRKLARAVIAIDDFTSAQAQAKLQKAITSILGGRP